MIRYCDACGTEGAKRRCSKCQGCWFCDKACAKRAWPMHQPHCTDDPALKRHVAIELAFERALAEGPKTQVPDDAVCYICLDGGALLRGCACRGESAGFVHVGCLAEAAARVPWMNIEGRGNMSRFSYCATCRQFLCGALRLEMGRRWWQNYRDTPNSDNKRHSFSSASMVLRTYGELDAANKLVEEYTQGMARDDPRVLFAEIDRAHGLLGTDPAATLRTLTALQPGVERCGVPGVRESYLQSLAWALYELGRYEEALPVAAEGAQLSTALTRPESHTALIATELHALALIKVGRVGEGKAMLAHVFATKTRLIGADHEDTRRTKKTLDSFSTIGA